MAKRMKTVWISFDLGIRGDYESLYSWLDIKKARECGDNLAVLNYQFSGDLVQGLTRELRRELRTNKLSRIYLIYMNDETGKVKGKWLFGGRKAAPWSGYAPLEGERGEDEA